MTGHTEQSDFRETTGYLERTETVFIATRRPDGSEQTTPIWAVMVDGQPYIRSGYGERSTWYRRVLKEGGAVFVDGRHRYPVCLEQTGGEALDIAVDQAYRDKYLHIWPGPTHSMTTSPARGTTLRVLPAAEEVPGGHNR
ncbi:DUF2255 family protein [Streptomyces sp. J2-1]|uniref:DUF2255 family protein n=1 Tax=Streptomyces corallincola TaxID=2851888 RepID=UPI001C3911B6|nr:DUF2255 family protein [Streptomyces corallincola]MBV2358104.1 DUF2255 family protein [Streptomyces corallincola]